MSKKYNSQPNMSYFMGTEEISLDREEDKVTGNREKRKKSV